MLLLHLKSFIATIFKPSLYNRAFLLAKNITAAIYLGCYFILLTVFLLLIFQVTKKRRQEMTAQVMRIARITYKGDASHYRGSKSAGGGLYLADNCLIFKTYNKNKDSYNIEIPIDRILYTFYKHNYRSTADLDVVTKNEIIKFLVTSGRVWADNINETRKIYLSLKDGPEQSETTNVQRSKIQENHDSRLC